MMKRKHILAKAIALIAFCSLVLYCQPHDEGPSYHIYFINNRQNDIFFITGNINIQNKSLQLEYEQGGRANIKVNVTIGEIIGDFEDVKFLDSLVIVTEHLKYLEKSKIEEFNVRNIRKGMKMIIWVKDEVTKQTDFSRLDKVKILECVKAIDLEQQRLTIFGINKGAKALFIEAARNREE